MARRKVRAESRARYYIRQEAAKRGWNISHVARAGDFLEENEIEAFFPKIGLKGDKPDFLICLAGNPAIVVEAKNEAGKVQIAVNEAMQYADQINASGDYDVRIAVGAAGEEDSGFTVEVRFRSPEGWTPLISYEQELTTLPSKREAELALAADDGTTVVQVPAANEFIDAALELSVILRHSKVEAPLRPKVIGAVTLAMYEGEIDTAQSEALQSINNLVRSAIEDAGELSG